MEQAPNCWELIPVSLSFRFFLLSTLALGPRFVEEVKKQCADMDAQWDERQKTRAEETEAISKVNRSLGKLGYKGEKCYSLRQAEFVILKSLRFCWVNTKPQP